jgi:hypothetical protein
LRVSAAFLVYLSSGFSGVYDMEIHIRFYRWPDEPSDLLFDS